MLDFLAKSKWFVIAALFAFCAAPTFISYQPYMFAWDDSEYLLRSVAVSRSFWSGNTDGLLRAMVSVRPPAMTLMGLPYRQIASWEAANKCFITLDALTALLSVACLYMLLRIGVKPFLLIAAGVCVLASMGPYPAGASLHGPFPSGTNTHLAATAFLGDSLLAWTSLAALLLIPYEARTHSSSVKWAIARGVLWGSIFSLGMITKVNFLYFVALILPTLFLLKLRNGGLRAALAAFAAFAYTSAPSAFYLNQWGQPAFENARANSFGWFANFFYIPLGKFLSETLRESPGVAFFLVMTLTGLGYLLLRRRKQLWGPDSLALLIVIGFGIVVLAASNKQIRYLFPVFVALPFLVAISLSGKTPPASGRAAAVVAGLVFFFLLVACLPTRHRATRQSISRPETVLAMAAGCNAKRILLATDSPTLNQALMELAIIFSAPGKGIRAGTLSWHGLYHVPIQMDYDAMSAADEVVFQNADALYPAFTNVRVSDYEHYLQKGGFVPAKCGADLRIYSIHCRR